MDLRITIDISERLAGALNAIADALKSAQSIGISEAIAERNRHLSAAGFNCVLCADSQPAQMTSEPIAEAEPVVIPPAPESAPAEVVQPQETAITETPVNDDTPAVELAPEKPKKKKASKKPVEAPEPALEPEAPVTQPAPEPAATAPTAPQETAKSDGDPMAGMTVVDAVQALVSEIQDKGIDMASVNARVRAKANEIGLTYASAACLIKAIGYVEARKVALGEK